MDGDVSPDERRSQRRLLGAAFSAIEHVADPFQRLAWLIDRHVELTDEEPGDFLRRFDPPGGHAYDTEARVRNYRELCCVPLFPRELIWSMRRHFRRQFLDVLGEANKLLGDVYGNYESDEDVVSAIARWVNFSQSPEPGSGVERVIEDLQKVSTELHEFRDVSQIYQVQGAVTQAFTESERLLRQMTSFYGRFLFGSDYLREFLEILTGEREARAEEDWECLLPQLERRYEVLMSEGLPEQERARAIREFAEYILSIKRPGVGRDTRLEGKLRAFQRRKRNFEYFARVELINIVNKWVTKLCRDTPWHRFIQVFGHGCILEPLESETATMEYGFLKKRGNRVESQLRSPESSDPLWIQRLRNLNRLRPLYLHDQDPDFLCRPNFDNARCGAEMLLTAFINLWREAQRERVFPPVIIVNRIVQVEPQVTRLDYVDEQQPHGLQTIRVQSSALPLDFSELLGREAYFSYRDKGESVPISAMVLIPVQEASL